MRNLEHYIDLTAYEALKNLEKERKILKKKEDDKRFRRVLTSIFNICEMSDFEIQGRIVLKDNKTGKIYK